MSQKYIMLEEKENDINDEKKFAENRDYLEALNNYYKMKFNYENEFNKDKNKIIKNETLSWKEKRKEFNALKKKCVNCKRPVGTVFSNTYDDKNFTRVLKAVCGDLQNPCPLQLIINSGYFDLITNNILKDEKDIEDAKVSVIKDKNNLLFNYITTEEAIQNFEHFKNEIKEIASSLEVTNELFISVTDNPEKIEAIKKLQLNVYNLIKEIKVTIKEFSETNNTLLIQDAVSIYVNRLNPKLNQLISMKYMTNRVDFDENDATYHLIQEKTNIQSLEYNYGKTEVVKYNIGLGENKREASISEIGKALKKSKDKSNVDIGNVNTSIQNNPELESDNDNDIGFFNQNNNEGEIFGESESQED